MRSFYKALVILLLPLFSVAQNNFQPGFAINLKGDTLHGFINYREWENNPRSIYFRRTTADAPVKLTPADTKYFWISVGHLAEYERYEGPVTTNNTDVNHIPVGRDTSFKQDTIFLKVVQKGKNLVLLSYMDNFKTRYFIGSNSQNKPEELIFRVYYNSIATNGIDGIVYENIYKNQLYQVALKANLMTKTLSNDIHKAEYTDEDIINIASKINQVSATDASINNKPKHTFFIAVILAAAVILFMIHDFATIN